MQVSKSIASVLKSLTRQERKILQLVADGLSSQEIATQLNISVLTIKTHRQNICQKAEVKGVAEVRKFVREVATYLKNTPLLLLLYSLSSIVGIF
jgi:DNA-binding CsgD family transcriptional regulator